MPRNEYRLLLALAISFLLHSLPWLADQIATPPPPPQPKMPLAARLQIPPIARPLPPPPPLILPEPTKPEAVPAKPNPKKIVTQEKPTAPVKTWTQAIAQHLKKLNEHGLFYPPEAIAQGLEGETLILMIIDENGRVIAARIEQGSGHRILDDAAVHAVRSLHSLPADTPHEAVLPVRFRLK